MPSPFPGMDPWLEGPLWTSFHAQFAVEIARQLTPRLVPRYVALTEQRFVLVFPEVEEGVSISHIGLRPDAAVATEARSTRGAPAGAAAIEPPLLVETIIPESVPQISVEIRDSENRQLVTAIEIRSPWNKRGEGRDEYLLKRRRILLSTAHLMEIDLLRAGDRPPMRGMLPEAPYFVFLSRADRRPLTGIWPIWLQERLPQVPIPLLQGDGDLDLDLQQAFSQVYDGFGYAYLIDYGAAPTMALEPAERQWAEQRIREHRRDGGK